MKVSLHRRIFFGFVGMACLLVLVMVLPMPARPVHRALLGLGLGPILAWGAARWGLLPLGHLSESLKHGSFRERVPRQAAQIQELKFLLKRLDQALSEGQSLLVDQRRFMADAAHALKTPLAVVAAQAHGVIKAQTAEDREAAGKELTEGVARAADMVRQLIHVARADQSGDSHPEAAVALADLVESRVGDVVPLALSRQQDLGLEILGHPRVLGDRVVLASMVDNLVGNALRYTPKGRVINVRVEAPPGLARLVVEDEGPGIPMEQRTLAVRRFVRLEPALATGSGLGLAIVHEGAQRMGGTLRLEDRPDGKQGLRAVLELPAEL